MIRNDNKPNTDLIVRFIQGDVTEPESVYIKALLKENDEWAKTYRRQKDIIEQINTLPVYNPPSRVWANIKSEIQHTQIKPVWLIRLEALFQPLQYATATACAFLLMFVWYAQVLNEQDFQIVDVSDVNGFSNEADIYLANHEIIHDDPITHDTLLAFYSEDTLYSRDDEC